MNILVLSPHRDDAAFSLSLSIAHWLSVGHRVTLLNVFTRSLHAPYSDADTVHENDRLSYVSAMRKKEDEAFLRRMPGLAMVDLNLKDAPIRLRCDTAAVCDIPNSPDDTAIPKIRKALAGFGEGTRPMQALVLPLGLGRHVDHVVVRDAALSNSGALPCAFYEELPHEEETRFSEGLLPVLCHGDQAFKLRIAHLYASQVDSEEAEAIAKFGERYGGAERLWVNQQWADVAESNKLSSGPIT